MRKKYLFSGVLLIAAALFILTAPVTGENPGNEKTILLKAVGDTVPGTLYPSRRMPKNPEKTFFSKVKHLFNGADVVFGNLECAMTDYPRTRKDTSRGLVYAFRVGPSMGPILKRTGFDVMSIANNHSLDFNWRGFNDTHRNLLKAGIMPTGKKNEIAVREYSGVKMAFIAFSYFSSFNNMHNLKQVRSLINKAEKQADIVVISVHAGAEGSKALHTRNKTEYFYRENRGNLVKFARASIDAGADLVLGHGPHVPRALEVHKNRLIAYSLGNFIGYGAFSTRGYNGYSLVLDVEMKTDGTFTKGRIHPLTLKRGSIPRPDSKKTTIRLMQRLTKQDFPRTGPKISSDGVITPH